MSEQISPDKISEIIELIYSGKKIAAVKLYMDIRNVSLIEAKQFIEQLTDKMKLEAPEKFNASPKSGCFGLLMLVAVSLTVAWYCAT